MTRTLVIVGLLLWAACGGQRLHEPMPEDRAREYRTCERDEQCVYTHNGCCDCMNGGADIAVRRDRLSAFRAQFDCADIGCTEMGGNCGEGRVACERGLCVYRGMAE